MCFLFTSYISLCYAYSRNQILESEVNKTKTTTLGNSSLEIELTRNDFERMKSVSPKNTVHGERMLEAQINQTNL